MKKLAYNGAGCLVKCGREYWVIDVREWYMSCYNSQEDDYNAVNALEAFKVQFGEPTWVREGIYRH